MNHPIITRFPPSPTGYLHVGGARTAIFNWLYARKMNGKFILRIEDTDIQRSTQESVDAILDALRWLHIDWDEGPYFQSQRFHIYTEYIQKLIDTGGAYYCSCSPERLEAIRNEALASGGKPKYDGACREKGLSKSDNTVIRFKAPLSGVTIVEDIIKGNIIFQNSELDDFIIQRSDGTPTYNFVVVVDDIDMKINTIIRGDDHVNNTPKQILLYKALGSPLPAFGHVPMVLGKDRTRLSKRHGAMSVTAYRDMGFLPDALINYLVRLGWSHGDQEFFLRNELIEKFNLEAIGKAAGIFDLDKLLSLNADHIKATPPEKLIEHLTPFLKQKGIEAEDKEQLVKIIKSLHTRSKTLIDMAEGALFYFQDKLSVESDAAEKYLTSDVQEAISMLIQELTDMTLFDEKGLEAAFGRILASTGLKMKKLAQPVRVALTGKTVSPGLYDIIDALGKDRAISRLKEALAFIQKKSSLT